MDVAEWHDRRDAAASQSGAGDHGHPRDVPLPGPGAFQFHVGDLHRPAGEVLEGGVVGVHLRPDQVVHHGDLTGAGAEGTHVH